jgi:hypothetical protein
MKYSKEKIVKALYLLLYHYFFTALLFIIMNREYSLYSIFVVFAGHGLVYLAYSILTVPFSFMVSILLNRYSILNLLTICISSLIIAMPFFVLLDGAIQEKFRKNGGRCIPTLGLSLWL